VATSVVRSSNIFSTAVMPSATSVGTGSALGVWSMIALTVSISSALLTAVPDKSSSVISDSAGVSVS